MGWFKWKGIMMPKFVMLENEPSPLKFEQVTSVIDMPDNVPLVYQTKGFRAQTISLIIGFRPGVWDTEFFNQFAGTNLTDDQCAAMNRHGIEQLQFDSVYNWLCNGGTLTFSNDSSRYYNAVCNVSIVPERISKSLRKLNVQFTVMPFRYALNNSPVEQPLHDRNEQEKDTTVTFQGTYFSEPAYKFYLTGNLYIMWDNRYRINITDVVESVTVDIQNRRVFDKDGNVILNRTYGEFMNMTLSHDTNLIVSSNVTKIEVTKNTRWR